MKISPALLAGHRAVGVSHDSTGDMRIWGVANLPSNGFVLEATDPGLIAVRVGERVRVLIRQGRITYLANDNTDNLLFLVAKVAEYPAAPTARFIVLIQTFEMLLRAMIRQGHGGTILWIPNDAPWREGVKSVKYSCEPPYQELMTQVSQFYQDGYPQFRQGEEGQRDDPERQELRLNLLSIKSAINAVGQLTAVDGATIVSEDLSVMAFGVMLNANSEESDARVSVLQAHGDSMPHSSALSLETVSLSELGGARHRSAAEFCLGSPRSLAFVASQDGGLTIFGWRRKTKCLFSIRGSELLLL